MSSDPKAVEHARRHREAADASEAKDTAALREHATTLMKNSGEKVSMPSLGYLDQSPYEDRCCTSCVMFQPNTGKKYLGTCSLIEGDINPHGWCRKYLRSEAS